MVLIEAFHEKSLVLTLVTCLLTGKIYLRLKPIIKKLTLQLTFV